MSKGGKKRIFVNSPSRRSGALKALLPGLLHFKDDEDD